MKNLAHLLPILDAPDYARVESAPPPLQLVASNEFPDPAPAFAQDVGATENIAVDRFQEGYDTGHALGMAQGRAQALAEHAGQDVAMEAFVAKARAQWTAEQAQRIADGVAKALKVIEDEIASCVERCLRDLVQDKMRSKVLGEFSDQVRALCRMGEAGVVTVHAPPDLAGALRDRLQDCPSVEFQSSETAQVWVRCGATLIEAKLAPWFASLAEAE